MKHNRGQEIAFQSLELLESTILLHNVLIDLGEQDQEDWMFHDDFCDSGDA